LPDLLSLQDRGFGVGMIANPFLDKRLDVLGQLAQLCCATVVSKLPESHQYRNATMNGA